MASYVVAAASVVGLLVLTKMRGKVMKERDVEINPLYCSVWIRQPELDALGLPLGPSEEEIEKLAAALVVEKEVAVAFVRGLELDELTIKMMIGNVSGERGDKRVNIGGWDTTYRGWMKDTALKCREKEVLERGG